MLNRMRNRLNEDGFTLIELMVVVLIIAILVAIAIPTFLGQRETAQDRAAQSNLRNALATEKTIYANTQAYTATDADLTAVEPSLDWTVDDAADGGVLPVMDTAASGAVCLISESASGTFFWIWEDPGAATVYGSGAAAPAATVAGCGAGAGW
jgi:type IV pilus assembly protein PilA